MIHWKQYNFRFMNEDTIYTFDTETSSYWVKPDGSVTAYDPSISNDEYNNDLKAGAVVYIWMIGINDTVIYGRELDELPEALKQIVYHATGTPIIYIHNAGYDFQFLRSVLNIEEVFSRLIRKPMKFTANDCEFRCSYMLTRLSLETWGESLEYQKQVGKLDYLKLRSPLTPLTSDELMYCEYDLLVMYAGLKKFRERYEEIKNIPLTQTGEVRRPVRNMFKKNMGYLHKITDLQPKTVNEYKRLRAVFRGGETHANRKYSCQILHDLGSFDKTSDYPYQMCAEKFPMSRFVATSKDLRFIKADSYAYIIEIVLYNVKVKTSNTYISRSHCQAVKKGKYDNGRIISAEKVATCITEQDWFTIKEMYDIESYEVVAVFRSRKQYLPKEFIEYILELYEYKTTLKDVEGKEELYMQSKQFLNSLFGMSVTDIILPDISYSMNDWIKKEVTEEDVQNKLDDLQAHFFKNFLAYQWGVWVTAYARRELMRAVIYTDEDEAYHDTDSCKCLNWRKYKTEYFEKENQIMDEKLRKMCIFYGIDFEKTRPQKPDGTKAPLGHWDFEGYYSSFKTLGAKKYAYIDLHNEDGTIKKKNKGIHVTVSGVPKKEAAALLPDLESFKEGFIFDREKCGRKLLTYLDGTNQQVKLPDGYIVHHAYAANMRNNSYTLGITDEYAAVIQEINDCKGIL